MHGLCGWQVIHPTLNLASLGKGEAELWPQGLYIPLSF